MAAVFAIAASIAGLLNDFVYDDKAMLVDVTRLRGLGHWREILSQPYWPPPFFDTLYRPVTSLFLAFQYAIGGGSPFVCRGVSIGLYAASAVLFYSLARRLVSPKAALAAAALWAVHPVHVEAVAQAVNQAELLVGIGAMAMAIVYVDARRAGSVSAGQWAFLVITFALMTCAKESAFVVPALLVLVEWLVITGESVRARLARLWGGYAAMLVVALAVLALRGVVLKGQALAGNPSAALGAAPLGDRMFAMLQVVPMWLRLFVWPLRLQVDFSPAELGMPTGFGVSEAMGVVVLAGAAATIALARKRSPAACFGLVWCAVALLPVSNIIPIYILLAERTLFVPSIGFFIAVAAAGQWLVASSTWPMRRAVLTAACAVLCALGLVRSVSRQLVWNSAHLRVKPKTARGATVALRVRGQTEGREPNQIPRAS
ncbi:MAG TPA: glycosyltransferase family 39 protein [Gemmatimonadaceae bacterium]